MKWSSVQNWATQQPHATDAFRFARRAADAERTVVSLGRFHIDEPRPRPRAPVEFAAPEADEAIRRALPSAAAQGPAWARHPPRDVAL